MAKTTRSTYVCNECGATSPAYLGKCPQCDAWNSMSERIDAVRGGKPVISYGQPEPVTLAQVSDSAGERITTTIGEFDRVLGGGFVRGSLVLLGGDPGIGKSTLVLQACANLATPDLPVLYVSGEESAEQIKLRAVRLQAPQDQLRVLTENDLDRVIEIADRLRPGLMVIDSIQVMSSSSSDSSAGSVTQVRECTARIMEWAKPTQTPVIVVGHVTKEGMIAGPRVLEHMVDAVLYLEGERFHQYRILRAVKNRFGSTDEVGVFEMAESGLREVANPSEAFLLERSTNAAGSVVAVTVEGTRPILIEVQALTVASVFGVPRRSANGIDHNRLQLLAAVLQQRAGLNLGNQDIYVNVVGGLKITEPAADLAVMLAIASSFQGRRVDERLVAIGEVGLSGEVRSVTALERRLGEASRLGFQQAVVPERLGRRGANFGDGIQLNRAATVAEAITMALRD